MNIYRVADNGRLFRFEEEGGGRITVSVEGDIARILSMYVPKNQRMQGMGGILLSIAEREAELRGAARMEVDLSETLWELLNFLNDYGYGSTQGSQAVSIPLKPLLTSSITSNILKQTYRDVTMPSPRRCRKNLRMLLVHPKTGSLLSFPV